MRFPPRPRRRTRRLPLTGVNARNHVTRQPSPHHGLSSCSYHAAGTGRALPVGMSSSDYKVVALQTMFAAPAWEGTPKRWLEVVRKGCGFDRARFEAAVAEAVEQKLVVLSRDDEAQRPDAETVGESQLIELA